ncbi:hypothetical protein NM208_g11740 [Fusarium decemcellulare]|uniref:Uncharacterized protein n=1 Tax=Fusarium decemcellulare TaxID=57161 RepID=A0ACC1RT98_9HYPO|nr:hypothetical protein NM208_g11740 [Fusarium decemcellulare]
MKSRATQGCWTCKRRKIGCDKTIPACNNCSRTGRVCLGYGLRLVWADRPDGRRKETGNVICVTASDQSKEGKDYGNKFLNFTFEDILSAKSDLAADVLSAIPPRPSLSLHTPLLGQDGMLLSYYKNVISPMVSTTRSRNGFSTELLPQALSSRSASASALFNAMLSISAFHRFGSKAALVYKSNAVRFLFKAIRERLTSSSLTRRSSRDAETQLAACMMLCMYSVFDEQDGSWHVHMDGAKKMLQSVHFDGVQYLSSNFLPNWFLYYEVLGNFTRPTEESLLQPDSLWLWQMSESDKSLIIGYLGCSVEVFETLHQINQLRTQLTSKEHPLPSAERSEQRLKLEKGLHNLVQRLSPEEGQSTTLLERTHTLAKANLYRLAALLYLQRVCPLDGDEMTRSVYLEQAFDALNVLSVVSSPWPLFIVASEARSDEQRIAILQMLDDMEKARNIGNIYITRTIIEAFWKQQDMRVEDNSREQLRSASPTTLQLLRDLHKQALDEEPFVSTNNPLSAALEKFVALDPDKCALVYLLLRSIGARYVVEAGTSFGLSTIYLALAVAQNASSDPASGKVIGTENEPTKASKAREHWKAAGDNVEKFIELREGDLRETLQTDLPQQVDFLLLDIWTPLALPALKLVRPRLRVGAMVVVDNWIAAKEGYKDLKTHLDDPASGFKTSILPYDGGLLVAVYCVCSAVQTAFGLRGAWISSGQSEAPTFVVDRLGEAGVDNVVANECTEKTDLEVWGMMASWVNIIIRRDGIVFRLISWRAGPWSLLLVLPWSRQVAGNIHNSNLEIRNLQASPPR